MKSTEKDFAKVFGSGRNQIIVLRDRDSEGGNKPCLRILYDLQIAGFNVGEMMLKYDTVKERDAAFNSAGFAEFAKRKVDDFRVLIKGA